MRKMDLFDLLSALFTVVAIMMLVAMFTNVWLDFTQFTLAPKFGMANWDPTLASAAITSVIFGISLTSAFALDLWAIKTR